MTKEELKEIRSSLRMCSDSYYVSCHNALHECCDGRVCDTNREINFEGHAEDCHVMKSIKLIDKELEKF